LPDGESSVDASKIGLVPTDWVVAAARFADPGRAAL